VAVKEHTARFAKALLANDVPMETIVLSLSDTGYSPQKSTLYQHIARLESGDGPIFSETKEGRPAALTEEQWHVVAGWVLLQEKKVDLWTTKLWIKNNYQVGVSVATVSRRKEELGLAVRLTNARPMKANITHEDYVLGYFDYVNELHRSGFFNFNRKKVLCLDSVTNSMRKEREKTISLKGGTAKKLAQNLPIYTNNYLVCVAMEPGLSFDVLMFTHDPMFDPNGPGWTKVQRWCRKLNIRTDQIFYTKSTRKYCAEDKSHISTFKARYRKELRGCRVMHDGGPAYKHDGQYILEDGADALSILPSDQHGQLSPLDNKLNAVAKALWRIDRRNKDFSYDALLLLNKLEAVGSDDISKWWISNFLLDVPKLSVQAVQDRIGEIRNKPPIRQGLSDKYIAAYEEWLEHNVEVLPEGVDSDLEDELDGDFWRKK